MLRVNKLLADSDFLGYLQKNRDCEASRIYCRHDLTHALDVARIAWILNLEEDQGLDKEVVYAAALVHDIGRWREYETGISHAEASRDLAEDLLTACGFTPAETDAILLAVGGHRSSGGDGLSGLLYRADKLSRNCPGCASIQTCKKFQHGEKPFLSY